MNRLRVCYAPNGQAAGSTLPGNGESGTGEGANSGDNGQGNSGSAGTQSAGWRSIAPAEYRDHDFLKGFEKPADFFKAAVENSDKLSRAIVKPKEGATAEELTAYRKELGLPEKADSYDVATKLGDKDIPEEMLKGLKQSYFDSDLTPDQATAVHGKLLGLMSEGQEMFKYYDQQMAQKITADADTQKAESLAQLGKDWGDRMGNNIAEAKTMLSAVLTQEEINSMPIDMQNSPILVKALYNMKMLVSDDSLLGGRTAHAAAGTRMFPNSPGMYKDK